MVGRELPNLRPNGEDHRGAGGGRRTGMLDSTIFFLVMTLGFRNWNQTMTKVTMIKVLACPHNDLGVL